MPFSRQLLRLCSSRFSAAFAICRDTYKVGIQRAIMKGIALSPFLMAAENFLIASDEKSDEKPNDSTAAFTSQNVQVKASTKKRQANNMRANVNM